MKRLRSQMKTPYFEEQITCRSSMQTPQQYFLKKQIFSNPSTLNCQLIIIDDENLQLKKAQTKCDLNTGNFFKDLSQKEKSNFVNKFEKNMINCRKDDNIKIEIKDKVVFLKVSQEIRQKLINLKQSQNYIKLFNVIQKLILHQIKFNQIDSSNGYLLGGGGCVNSKTHPQKPEKFDKGKIVQQNLKKIDSQKQKNNKVHRDFEKSYSKYIKDQENKKYILENDYQIAEMHKIFEECINTNRLYIVTQIDVYRAHIFEIYDTILQYMVSGVENDQAITDDIKSLQNQIKLFKESTQQRAKTHQCLDLIFMTQFLSDLNEQRVGIDERNKSQFEKIAQLIITIVNLGVNIGATVMGVGTIALSLKSIITNSADLIEQVKKFASAASSTFENVSQLKDKASKYLLNKENVLKYLASLWVKKAELLASNESFSIADEILFYIDEYFELTKSKCSNNLILFIMTQINYLMDKGNFNQEQDKSGLISQKLSFNNEKIKCFIESLQQKSLQKGNEYYENFKIFFKFTVVDPTFRFLANQILLKYNHLLLNQNEVSNEDRDNFWIHLCYSYVTEKDDSVKIVFQKDSRFVDRVNQIISEKNSNVSKKIIKKQKTRINDFKLNDLTDSDIFQNESQISDENDFLEKISLNLLEKWELEARERLDKDIAFKDDALLEVQDLYIDQNIIHLSGNSICKNNGKNDKDDQSAVLNSNKLDSTHKNKNAIEDIIESFIEPAIFRSSNCKILGILSEGGTGKSMLIKRLETMIIKEKNSIVSEHECLKNVIPLLVKCNSLHQTNPSLGDYFLNQGIEIQQFERIKQSSKFKLILLDGYDEYSGDYFRIYYKLQLSEWKNTLIIVTSRKEKLNERDASAFFSLDDESGKRDESSFSIFQLQEFQRKDIDEYCKKYFTKQRINANEEVDKFQIDNDIRLMMECLNNKSIESLLFLPINLYLFTRMVAKSEEKDFKELIKNISDQLSIQEIFFQEQFNREAIDYIQQNLPGQTDKQLKERIASAYFEYFQSIAMQMFLNKGKIPNFLILNKDEIQFNLQNSLKKILKADNQKKLISKITSYINTKIITKVKETIISDGLQQDTPQIIEFKHKSLFEYFVARAMKFDFDIHGENIHQLDLQILKEFNINKRSIMNAGSNQSEQQVLLKLYKLLQNEIDSTSFRESYCHKNIEKMNRYFQYLNKSSINTMSDISDIDIGSSNLLSALFLSKFAYPHLRFTKCSFSRAYIPYCKSNTVNFDQCNLNNAYLKNSNLSNFETSLTNNAMIESFQKEFDTDNSYSFNSFIFNQSTLISISKTGFINSFVISNQGHQLQLSQKITCQPLKAIQLIKNKLIISSLSTLFEIHPVSLIVEQTYKFDQNIKNISAMVDNAKYAITLDNNLIYYGNIQTGFNQIQVKGENVILSKKYLMTSCNNQMFVYSIEQNWKLLKQLDCQYQYGTSNKAGNILITVNKNCFQIWDTEKDFYTLNQIENGQTNIESIQFSNDGKTFATGSLDKTCKIYNVDKGFELIHTIKDHSDTINTLAFSNDGQYLATGSIDNTIQITNTQINYQNISTIQGHTNWINSVAFSHDGKYLATSSEDKTCKVWYIKKELEQIKTIQHKDATINSVAFSPDNKYLATGCDDNSFQIWILQDNFQLLKTVSAHNGSINTVSFSLDGKYFATGSSDKTCKLWDINNDFNLIFTAQRHTNSIFSLAFTADSQYLATGSSDSICKIWNLRKNYELVHTLKGHSSQIYSLAFSQEMKYLATSSSDKTCKIWNVQKGFDLVNTIQGHVDSVFSLAFSYNNKYLATGSYDNTCKVWNVEKGFELINTIQGHHSSITKIAFSYDSKYLATGSNDHTCKVWNVEKSFELISQNQGHSDWVNQIAFSQDCKYLASCSDDSTCKIWSIEKGIKQIYSINNKNDQIKSVAFSHDCKYIAVGTSASMIQIFDKEQDFKLINTIKNHSQTIKSVVFSADGKYLATGSKDNTCKIWSVQNNFQLLNTIQSDSNTINFSSNSKYLVLAEQLCKIYSVENSFELFHQMKDHTNQINSAVFSTDSLYLATGSSDGTCKIYNANDHFKFINTIKCFQDQINSITFSPNSKYLVTGSYCSICKIWDVENDFSLINIIKGHTGSINSVTFSSDGLYLATGSSDNKIKLWNAQKGFEQINVISKNDGQVFKRENGILLKLDKQKQNNNSNPNYVQYSSILNYTLFDEIYVI